MEICEGEEIPKAEGRLETDGFPYAFEEKRKVEKLRIARILLIQSTGPRIFESGDLGEEPGKDQQRAQAAKGASMEEKGRCARNGEEHAVENIAKRARAKKTPPKFSRVPFRGFGKDRSFIDEPNSRRNRRRANGP